MIDVSPYVQILAAPVPQVDNVMASFRLLDKPIADQVIAVPKISCPSSCPSRAFLRVPQVVEVGGIADCVVCRAPAADCCTAR